MHNALRVELHAFKSAAVSLRRQECWSPRSRTESGVLAVSKRCLPLGEDSQEKTFIRVY